MLMHRIAWAATLGVTTTLFFAAPAFAAPALTDGPIVDPGGGDGVDISIYVGGTPGSSVPVGVLPVGGDTGGGPQCDYLALPSMDDPGPPVQRAYRYQCDDGTAGYVLVPEGNAPDAVPEVTPGQLAQQVRNRLQLPKPAVSVNPPNDDPARFQLVNFPTWWWVTNFAPLKQRTDLGNVWAEVTATPIYSMFDGGQGDSSRCDGAGMAWHPGLPGDFRGACSYTYRQSAENVTATVTVTWQVTWVGSGSAGGTLDPMQLGMDLPLTVYERQAVNVPYGS